MALLVTLFSLCLIGCVDKEENTTTENNGQIVEETKESGNVKFSKRKENKDLYAISVLYTGDSEEDLTPFYKFEYDSTGNLIKYIIHPDDETEAEIISFEYNANENSIKEISSTSDTILEYNEKGNRIRKSTQFYNWDRSITKNKATENLEYDEYNNCVSAIFCDDGECYSEIIIAYDEHNYPISKTIHNKTETSYSTCQNEYDQQGNRIKSTVYADNGYTITYLYDEHGNMTKAYDGSMVDYIAEYEYDDHGNITKCKKYENGELFSIAKAEYVKVKHLPIENSLNYTGFSFAPYFDHSLWNNGISQ